MVHFNTLFDYLFFTLTKEFNNYATLNQFMSYWRELHFDSEMGNYNLTLQCIIYTSRVAACIPIKIEIHIV